MISVTESVTRTFAAVSQCVSRYEASTSAVNVTRSNATKSIKDNI